MYLADATYLYVDCETTGLGEGHSPVEIAGVLLRHGEILDRFESLINPGRPISPESTAIHHISDDMVRYAPPLTVGVRRLVEMLQHADAVASHSIDFDRPMMKFADNHVWICSLTWSQHEWPNEKNTLAAVSERIGLKVEGRMHSAMTDTLAGSGVLTHLLKASPLATKYTSLDDLAQFLKGYKREFLAEMKRRKALAVQATQSLA